MDELLQDAQRMSMGEEIEKISFYDEEQGGFAEFFVIERTRVNGTEYLLATQELEADADGYIFKVAKESVGADGEPMLELELVEDETELQAVGSIFAELVGEEMNIEI